MAAGPIEPPGAAAAAAAAPPRRVELPTVTLRLKLAIDELQRAQVVFCFLKKLSGLRIFRIGLFR